MKIGIVSDTHGFVENFKEVIQYFKKNGIETIIHLGDDWADTKILEKEKIPFLRVPGVYCPEYKDPLIPNRTVRRFEGARTLISHTEKSHKNDLSSDIKPEELIKKGEIDVILFGHSHIPLLEIKEGIFFYQSRTS